MELRIQPVLRLVLISLPALLCSACVVLPLDAPRLHSPAPVVLSAPLPAAPQLLQVRLYPLNDEAGRAGALAASVLDQQDGRGRFTIAYQGRNLQGEASRVPADYPGFGQLLSGLGEAAARTPGRRGIANAAGGGLHAACEYVLSASAQGVGACLFSDGARYQMHFGQ